jgi:hypothetical protein
MTGKELLDYLSKCTHEQLSKPIYMEENVDDGDGGYSVLKELDSVNFYSHITNPDYNKTDNKVLKGFEFRFSYI